MSQPRIARFGTIGQRVALAASLWVAASLTLAAGTFWWQAVQVGGNRVRACALEGGDDVDALARTGEEDADHARRGYRRPVTRRLLLALAGLVAVWLVVLAAMPIEDRARVRRSIDSVRVRGLALLARRGRLA